jgi:hypothetical protein
LLLPAEPKAGRLVPGPVFANVTRAGAGRRGANLRLNVADCPRWHNLRQALTTFAPDARGSDCDYRHVQVVLFKGKREIATWLRKRFADDDHLGIARLWNGSAAQPVGVVVAEWAIRKSRTLRRLGFAHGIVPQLSAKIVFTRGFPPRIAAFANGPGG